MYFHKVTKQPALASQFIMFFKGLGELYLYSWVNSIFRDGVNSILATLSESTVGTHCSKHFCNPSLNVSPFKRRTTAVPNLIR